jgi:hypothetical protein
MIPKSDEEPEELDLDEEEDAAEDAAEEDADEDDGDEAEVSAELAQLLEIPSNVEEDIARLKALQKKGKLQGDILGSEIISTVLPLLLSLANAVAEFSTSSEAWAEGVDETLDALEESFLRSVQVKDTELELFRWLFIRFQEFLSAARQAPDMPEESKKALDEIDMKLQIALSIVGRAKAENESDEKAGRDSRGQEAS